MMVRVLVLDCVFASKSAVTPADKGFADFTTSALLVADWGRKQLLALLGCVMIRSCKADLALLPPCYKKVGTLCVIMVQVTCGYGARCPGLCSGSQQSCSTSAAAAALAGFRAVKGRRCALAFAKKWWLSGAVKSCWCCWDAS
jgi:hypothetical protein